LESATPAVDQPVDGVDRREVREMLCSHFTITTWSTAATLPLLLVQTSKYGFTTKEELSRVKYSIYNEVRELSSQRTKISPMKQIYNIYNVWQTSLVLGGLGRA